MSSKLPPPKKSWADTKVAEIRRLQKEGRDEAQRLADEYGDRVGLPDIVDAVDFMAASHQQPRELVSGILDGRQRLQDPG